LKRELLIGLVSFKDKCVEEISFNTTVLCFDMCTDSHLVRNAID